MELDGALKIVNDLLKRLYLSRLRHILMRKRILCDIAYLLNRIAEGKKLCICIIGERDIFIFYLLCGFGNVYGVVGYTLQVSYHMEELCNLDAFRFRHISCGKMHEVGAERVLVNIDLVLLRIDLLNYLGIEIVKKL